MIAFPGMLVESAKSAGMKVPENADDFDPKDFPHFEVFCLAQLGSSMPYSAVVWDNAKVVAENPLEKIQTITFNELYALGFQVGCPIP